MRRPEGTTTRRRWEESGASELSFTEICEGEKHRTSGTSHRIDGRRVAGSRWGVFPSRDDAWKDGNGASQASSRKRVFAGNRVRNCQDAFWSTPEAEAGYRHEPIRHSTIRGFVSTSTARREPGYYRTEGIRRPPSCVGRAGSWGRLNRHEETIRIAANHYRHRSPLPCGLPGPRHSPLARATHTHLYPYSFLGLLATLTTPCRAFLCVPLASRHRHARSVLQPASEPRSHTVSLRQPTLLGSGPCSLPWGKRADTGAAYGERKAA